MIYGTLIFCAVCSIASSLIVDVRTAKHELDSELWHQLQVRSALYLIGGVLALGFAGMLPA